MGNEQSSLTTEWLLAYPELELVPEVARGLVKRGVEPLLPEVGVLCGTCYFLNEGSASHVGVTYYGCTASAKLQKGRPIHMQPEQVIPSKCYMGLHMEEPRKPVPQQIITGVRTLWRRVTAGL